MKFSSLTPMYLEEIIPGDKFKVSSEIFMRFAPLLAPVMHRINVYTHFFFVPNRLVWNEWEDFITGGEDGNAAPEFPVMWVSATLKPQIGKGSLADYLGIPQPLDTNPSNQPISAIPFRAYQQIYNDYYRDENLITKLQIPKGSGLQDNAENAICATMRTRAWEKDYLTSSLPWSQRGGEASLPLSPTYSTASTVLDATTGVEASGVISADVTTGQTTTAADGDVRIENLENSGEVLINDLRKAVRLQEWLEKSARGGARYIEAILSHFGVRSSDSRLQRPEYLGGGSQPAVISEVLNTTGTTNAPQGEMAGHGISVGKNNGFTRSFEEHGYVIGIISVMPKTAYQNGLARTWTKFDKFDYYWPEFANLGEQEVKESEVWTDFGSTLDFTNTFGYQQRYAEYKYKESMVSGDFKDTLAFWHLGRIFDSTQTLNETFITCNADTRIFAVEDGTDYLWVQIYHRISAIRPMPYFAIPTL